MSEGGREEEERGRKKEEVSYCSMRHACKVAQRDTAFTLTTTVPCQHSTVVAPC